jgi:hypothetical protein
MKAFRQRTYYVYLPSELQILNINQKKRRIKVRIKQIMEDKLKRLQWTRISF